MASRHTSGARATPTKPSVEECRAMFAGLFELDRSRSEGLNYLLQVGNVPWLVRKLADSVSGTNKISIEEKDGKLVFRNEQKNTMMEKVNEYTLDGLTPTMDSNPLNGAVVTLFADLVYLPTMTPEDLRMFRIRFTSEWPEEVEKAASAALASKNESEGVEKGGEGDSSSSSNSGSVSSNTNGPVRVREREASISMSEHSWGKSQGSSHTHKISRDTTCPWCLIVHSRNDKNKVRMCTLTMMTDRDANGVYQTLQVAMDSMCPEKKMVEVVHIYNKRLK